jgi:D-xylose transport system permease protein
MTQSGNNSVSSGLSLGGFKAALLETKWLPIAIFFAVVAISFNIATDGLFLSPRNVTLLMRQASITSILAMAVAILIIKGEIDLSIGSAVYLCGTAAAAAQVYWGQPVATTLLFALAIGLLLGAWQGFWVVALGVPSFVVTLAGLLGFRGIGYYLSDTATIAPMTKPYAFLSEGFVPIPASLALIALLFFVLAINIYRAGRDSDTGQRDMRAVTLKILGTALICGALAWVFSGFRGIPNAVLWVAACGSILWFMMSRTVFGRNAYLIGSNREAARLAGIDVKRHLFYGFVLMGAFYAVAGVLTTARLSASTPALGQFLELDAIAAAVIGGVSLRGGVGSVIGAIAGAALLVAIDNGMSLLNISSYIQMVIKAMLLLFALVTDALYNSRR